MTSQTASVTSINESGSSGLTRREREKRRIGSANTGGDSIFQRLSWLNQSLSDATSTQLWDAQIELQYLDVLRLRMKLNHLNNEAGT